MAAKQVSFCLTAAGGSSARCGPWGFVDRDCRIAPAHRGGDVAQGQGTDGCGAPLSLNEKALR